MGKPGKREFVQMLRLMEAFRIDDVTAAVGDAIARGAIGFDAIKHLVLYPSSWCSISSVYVSAFFSIGLQYIIVVRKSVFRKGDTSADRLTTKQVGLIQWQDARAQAQS